MNTAPLDSIPDPPTDPDTVPNRPAAPPGAADPAAENSADNDGSKAAPAPDDSYPYWIPPGLAIDGWPPHIRAHVAGLINHEYRELVLQARPGVARQMAISLLHLTWLEVLDHLRLGRVVPAGPWADPHEVLGVEPRIDVIARHLRLINSKLKVAQFMQRLEEFRARCQPSHDAALDPERSPQSTIGDVPTNDLLKRVMQDTQDEYC